VTLTRLSIGRGCGWRIAKDGGPHETQAPIPVGGEFTYRLRFPDPGLTGITLTSGRITPRNSACTATSLSSLLTPTTDRRPTAT
jgi:hypothetical protein